MLLVTRTFNFTGYCWGLKIYDFRISGRGAQEKANLKVGKCKKIIKTLLTFKTQLK